MARTDCSSMPMASASGTKVVTTATLSPGTGAIGRGRRICPSSNQRVNQELR